MENRAAKLALARKKLKDHQEKKTTQRDDNMLKVDANTNIDNPSNTFLASNTSNLEEYIISPDSEGMASALYVAPPAPDTLNGAVDVVQSTVTDVTLPVNDISITEILISNKRNLELQVHELQTKLGLLESDHSLLITDFRACNQQVKDLGYELKNIKEKYFQTSQEMLRKDSKINELNSMLVSMTEENSNLLEQLEITKAVVNAKETENESLQSKLNSVQHQYDSVYLQLQQLTNGLLVSTNIDKMAENERNEILLQKNTSLEQQLSLLHKERDQMTLHYEHYVAELNNQLKSAMKKNQDLDKEVQMLSNRENSLIEQISDMEIRIQNYNIDKKKFEIDQNTTNIKVLQEDLKQSQDQLSKLQIQHKNLQMQYAESETRIKELTELQAAECDHDNISITKLSADMTSDKVAAQRATEQNKKLKQDFQGLEDAFVKMTKDKLELTEKLTAEKYLNRELTIKLAEVEENAKEMTVKLKAKDEEMIRLLSNYREIVSQYENIKNCGHDKTEIAEIAEEETDNNNIIELKSNSDVEHRLLIENDKENCLQKGDAMLKLQERFLKIMGEVADLSDEKHRLEHIILQLQNETDTICEYVALYQQQRSLLKRRDEERTAQLKIFQQECGKLKCELEELSGILARFANDKELLSYFQIESRRVDMERVTSLLTNLKNNSLIDPIKKNIEFKNFYPCNCCSGQLINV